MSVERRKQKPNTLKTAFRLLDFGPGNSFMITMSSPFEILG